MSGGEGEAVAIEPLRVLRVVLEEFLPKHVGHGGGAHRQARMARIRRLDRIDGERANGINGERLERCVGSGGNGHEAPPWRNGDWWRHVRPVLRPVDGITR